jgi:hypothetical protein
LIISGELGQGGLSVGICVSFELHDRFEADAPMGAHSAVVDFPFIEQLDQRRARDIEHVGRFLSRQFSVDRD